MNIQEIAIILIVFAALAFALGRLRKKGLNDCGSCSGCPSEKDCGCAHGPADDGEPEDK